MSAVPRTPSPRPKRPSGTLPETPQLRAFSLSTLNGRSNRGNQEPVSPTSRAILNRYMMGLPAPSSNKEFREPSPFYTPSDPGSDSARRKCPKPQQKLKSACLPSVSSPLRPLTPGSPCLRRARKQHSRLGATSDSYTAKDVAKEDPVRESLPKELRNLRPRKSVPSVSHKNRNTSGTQLLARTASSKKRSASQYESTEDSHDNPVDDGQPVHPEGSEIDQGSPKKRRKLHPS
ncbi:hypothetical protein F4814DRAFT_360429 [Daldinia grandis]|nr:hypothetical protein F4814DRAFT_360429 [Daldinia grandis]